MTSPSKSITQDRIRILDEMSGKYSLAMWAFNYGQLSIPELTRWELKFRHEAIGKLVTTGLDIEPATTLVDDQFSCMDQRTGEVII